MHVVIHSLVYLLFAALTKLTHYLCRSHHYLSNFHQVIIDRSASSFSIPMLPSSYQGFISFLVLLALVLLVFVNSCYDQPHRLSLGLGLTRNERALSSTGLLRRIKCVYPNEVPISYGASVSVTWYFILAEVHNVVLQLPEEMSGVQAECCLQCI